MNQIKKFANRKGWSDIYPYEVVEIKTPNKVLVRRMVSELISPAKIIESGGFAAYFDNSSQKWNIISEEKNPIIAIRYSKAKNIWQDKYGNKYTMNDYPIKHYDYNF